MHIVPDVRQLTLILVAAAVAAAAGAQGYPVKPIRVVVAQPPGGSTDAVVRLFGHRMGETLGQQFVVDNRAGGGIAGLALQTLVAHANADGYTLLAVVPNFTFTPALVKNATTQPRDFAPVSLLSRDPYAVTTPASLPVKSVREFIALAKSKPASMNMGSGNIGSGTHMISMYFLSEAGIAKDVTYVPYKGTGMAYTDLLAGRLQAGVFSIVSVGAHVKAGKVRVLGVTSDKRSAEWPEVPTIAEQGLPGFEATAWYGLVAPLHTPAAVIGKLSGAAALAAKAPEITGKITVLGGEPMGSTPAQFAAMIAREIPRWRRLINELGMAGTLE